jgi:hypothetical protein
VATDDTASSPGPWVNRLLAAVLRSPLSPLVDRGLMLLTVAGRRTGRRYTFPVQYVQHGATLWVVVGAAAGKTWWRNLVEGAPVEVLRQRRARNGRAVASTHASAPTVVEDGLRRYAARFPRTAKRLRLDAADPVACRRAAEGVVVVRIDLADLVPEAPTHSSTRA